MAPPLNSARYASDATANILTTASVPNPKFALTVFRKLVPKPQFIQLGHTVQIPILFEDRSILAIDKPPGWILAPSDWDRTGRNLQLAISSSIRGGEFWARSRNLKFLRFVHRLDAETSGVLLFAKSPGAVAALSRIFETRQVEKVYYTVVQGIPGKDEWVCRARLAPDPHAKGRVRVDAKGKEAETKFVVEQRGEKMALVRALPFTGRTHQIRVHLQESGFAILGDPLYGSGKSTVAKFPLALRAAELNFREPFSRRNVHIAALMAEFSEAFGFSVRPEKKKGANDAP